MACHQATRDKTRMITAPSSRGCSEGTTWVYTGLLRGCRDCWRSDGCKHRSTDHLLTTKQNISIRQAPGKQSLSPGSPASSRRGHSDMLHLLRWDAEDGTLLYLPPIVFDLTLPARWHRTNPNSVWQSWLAGACVLWNFRAMRGRDEIWKGLIKEGWRNGEVTWWQDSELKIKEREEEREKE